MRKRILPFGLALAVAASAWAMNARYSSGVSGISVTQTNTNTAFTDNHSGGTSAAFNARSGYVCSRAASVNSCYFDLDGVATTADVRVGPGACVPFTFSSIGGGDGFPGIGSICATGETATFDIVGAR